MAMTVWGVEGPEQGTGENVILLKGLLCDEYTGNKYTTKMTVQLSYYF